MTTTKSQDVSPKGKEESLLPYFITWAMAIGAFTLLIYVGVWAVRQ
jgi:hypothetical protein